MTNPALEQSVDVTSSARPGAALPYFIYAEIMKMMRIPMFAIFTVLFPTLLFAMFGLPSIDEKAGGVSAGQYMMASFGTYAVMGVALFSFGVSIASERGMGWQRLLRATSMSSMTYFTAKIVMAIVVGLATLALLFLFGAVVAHVRMPVLTWIELIGLLAAGMVPFVALGLWIGYLGGPQTASVLANLVNLPMSFVSGVFIPLNRLPDVLQNIAPYMPSYHMAQLGWGLLGAGDGRGLPYHLVWLAAYTVVFIVLGTVAYKRDEGKTYG